MTNPFLGRFFLGEQAPSAANIRFTSPNPFRRLRDALRGNHAVPVRRSKPSPIPETRQAIRAELRRQAYSEMRQENPKLERRLRRPLARAYAARAWRERYSAKRSS